MRTFKLNFSHMHVSIVDNRVYRVLQALDIPANLNDFVVRNMLTGEGKVMANKDLENRFGSKDKKVLDKVLAGKEFEHVSSGSKYVLLKPRKATKAMDYYLNDDGHLQVPRDIANEVLRETTKSVA